MKYLKKFENIQWEFYDEEDENEELNKPIWAVNFYDNTFFLAKITVNILDPENLIIYIKIYHNLSDLVNNKIFLSFKISSNNIEKIKDFVNGKTELTQGNINEGPFLDIKGEDSYFRLKIGYELPNINDIEKIESNVIHSLKESHNIDDINIYYKLKKIKE